MSQDPSLAAFTALARHEAEYDAVHAAVTATERGRWFLSEYANRMRKADTDLVMAALARIEASIGGGPLPQTLLWSADFAEAVPHDRIVVAAERLADLCFRLRESAVDAALCDGIEAAAQEIYQACGTANPATAAAAVPPAPVAAFAMAPIAAEERSDAALPAIDDDRSSAVRQEADESPRWHIEGPDFLFQPDAPEPDRDRVEPADRAERRHALLPESVFEPEAADGSVGLFERPDAGVTAAAAAAPETDVRIAVRNESSPETPPPALRVITSPVARPLPRPAPNDTRGPMPDLSEEELIALFG